VVFNSLAFVVFFAIVLGIHNLPFSWRTKKINLLLASYIFYAAWNPPFILLLWLATLVDWFAARFIFTANSRSHKRMLLALSLVVNLGVLGVFKYGSFLLKNWQALLGTMGIEYQPPAWNIVLPVGISFYTFQSMSYALDVYFGRAKPIRSFLDYALFVTLFVHLVAGPILRIRSMAPQFAEPRRATRDALMWGLLLMTLGMFEKVVVADGALAPTANAVFGFPGPLNPLDAWLGTFAFSGQILCDFAGYSTIAIGAALCLGFSLPDNFKSPYAAIGFTDFWRRWHIALSTWLRDYLYIPLGGNRRGPGRTYLNLMVTMLLGGLWHGANWTFLAWGALHGAFLAGERWIQQRTGGRRLPRNWLITLVLILLTWLLVSLAWVLFRSQSFLSALLVFFGLFGVFPQAPRLLPTIYLIETAVTIFAILGIQWFMRERTLESVVSRTPWWVVSTAWAAMLFAVIVTQGTGTAFIYFQF
jgi:alginate O-acetyltransferase complex protein AlgI